MVTSRHQKPKWWQRISNETLYQSLLVVCGLILFLVGMIFDRVIQP